MKVKLLIVLCLSLSLALLSNCKKDPQPANPCAGKQLPKADFMLAEKLDGEERYFETDKINYVRDLFLRGPDGYKTYLWQVGTNLNWSTQKNAKVTFAQAEGKLMVRLITTREPMVDCFVDDDGIDTVEKWIDVVNKIENNNWLSPIIGNWEGKSTQFKDETYTIRFYSIDSSGNGSQDGDLNFYFSNILNNGCATNDFSDSPGYIIWSGIGRRSGCVFNYVAYTFPFSKDSLVVEYAVEGPAPDYKFIPYTFIGKRK